MPVLTLACLVVAARVAYLIAVCPYDLVEDEAQYWLWAKHLSLSYYSKGPGIAWIIGAATGLYGDIEWAVRLPGALLSGLGILAVGGLAMDLSRHARRADGVGGAGAGMAGEAGVRRAALWAAAAWALVPFAQMSGVLATIDGPLLACWAVAAWAGWRAFMMGSRSAWVVLGLALGAGFLFKYTMLLLVPGLVLAWWKVVRGREEGRAPGPHTSWRTWAALAGALLLLGTVPVVVWNAQHDFVTVRHLLGHLGLRGGDMPVSALTQAGGSGAGGRKWYEWLPVWPLELVLMQVGLVGPLLVVGAIGGWRLWKRAGRVGAGAVYLGALALPLAVFYLVVAYIAEPEGNWPIAVSATLVPLGVLWRLGVWDEAGVKGEKTGASGNQRWTRVLVSAGLLYGALAILPMHRADIAARVVNRAMTLGPVSSVLTRLRGDGLPPAPIVPGRLMGARKMGEACGLIMRDLRVSTGRAPFILSQHYGRAAQMAFYAPWPLGPDGRPARDSLCAGPLTGGRLSHFDFMPETSLMRVDLVGRPAVILSNDRADVRAVWDSLFENVRLYEGAGATGSGRLEGEHKRDRVVYVGYGYRGPASAATPGR